MADGPNDDDIRRAEMAAQKQKNVNEALSGYHSNNQLDAAALARILDKHAPGNDAVGDGVFSQPWLGTDTFYRFTEDYVPLESRLAFKMELERSFPGKKS